MILDGTLLWLVALVAVALWIPQNATHEYAHAFVARMYGATITKVVLYPNDEEGRFSWTPWAAGHAWARVWWSGGEYTESQRGLVSLAPVATNTVILIALIAARSTLDVAFGTSEVVASLIAAWAVTNFADGAYNLATFYRIEPRESTDGWGFQRRMELPVWACRVGAVAWHATFGVFLFVFW